MKTIQEMKDNSGMSEEESLEEFLKEFVDNMADTPSDFQKVIDENFWDLI